MDIKWDALVLRQKAPEEKKVIDLLNTDWLKDFNEEYSQYGYDLVKLFTELESLLIDKLTNEDELLELKKSFETDEGYLNLLEELPKGFLVECGFDFLPPYCEEGKVPDKDNIYEVDRLRAQVGLKDMIKDFLTDYIMGLEKI